eukprot:TRINITY_DN19049_c0_g3_i1.p1 TRINITY_DN19049_c0_g3~~TRINITY_DN19049_c0_g3_i1.p1  ORF type:complete len:1008 (+),score=215.91 TRINITY_DN19049_c0_g3_i1:80-3103(+)
MFGRGRRQSSGSRSPSSRSASPSSRSPSTTSRKGSGTAMSFGQSKGDQAAAQANLVTAIVDAVHAPLHGGMGKDQRQKQLKDCYMAAGAMAASVTLRECMRIIKDIAEDAPSKALALRVMDLLMELQSDALAIAAAAENVRQLSTYAKKLKDRKAPSNFPLTVTFEETRVFLVTVAELIDKWGRHYTTADEQAARWARTRQSLLADGVPLPQPEEYETIEPSSSRLPKASRGPPPPAPPPPPPRPPPRGSAAGLQEHELRALAEEARDASARNLGSPAAMEQRARFESALEAWVQAAEAAVERGDFGEFERLSEVVHRWTSWRDSGKAGVLPPLPPGGPTASSGGGASPRSRGPEKKKREKSEKSTRKSSSPSSTPEASPWGDPHRPVQDGGPPAFSFGSNVPPGANPGGFGAAAFPGGFGGAGFPDGPGGDFGSPSFQPPTGAPCGPPASHGVQPADSSPHGKRHGHKDPGRDADVTEQLTHALRRLRDLQPLERELQDARLMISSLREANSQLQREVEHCRREMRAAQKKAEEAQLKLTDRDTAISQTRQRLFDEKQRASKLEDEIKSGAALQQNLQSRLQSARSTQAETERELQRVMKSRSSESLGAAIRTADAYLLPQHGNVTYGSPYVDPASYNRGSPRGSANRRLPSVSRSDELAGSAPSSASGSRHSTPIRDASRHNGTSGYSNGGNMGHPGPLLLRSNGDVWSGTPVVPALGCITSRSPQPSHVVLSKVNSNFRRLLSSVKGVLYEDEHITMELAISAHGAFPGIELEAVVTNLSSQPIQQVRMVSVPTGQRHDCVLRIEQLAGGVAPQSRRERHFRFRGSLEVFGPFEAGPQVELVYLLSDNQEVRVVLRLPLTVARIMTSPAVRAVDGQLFLKLWESGDFAMAEVAVVCHLRSDLAVSGNTHYGVISCLEFGGNFRCIPGLDAASGVLLVSSYPQRQGAAEQVLVRVELGGPPGSSARASTACRVAVRSESNLVNRAVVQAVVDAIGEPLPPARVAA